MNKQNLSEPLISVIMPAYNCERYIGEAIFSVLGQTYKNYELIVIDDGSKDGTVGVVERLSRDNARIKFFKNDNNQGVSATRNRGVSLAKGEWIAFLDSDDQWEKTKLSKQIICANVTKGSLIYTGSSFINEKGEPYPGIMKVPEKVNFKQLLKQNVISCSSVLVKKSYLEKYKMERDDMHEDYAVWLRILKDEASAYGVSEPLLIYRIMSGSKSGNKVKASRMVFKVYRFVGLNYFSATFYWFWYLIKWIRKRKTILGY